MAKWNRVKQSYHSRLFNVITQEEGKANYMEYNYLKKKIEESKLSFKKLNTSTTGDGRMASAESEIVVIHHLEELFKNIEGAKVSGASKARCWYDVLIEFNGKTYPINIKITSGVGADNVSSKMGMFYSLTGLNPENVKGLNQWESFNKKLLENFCVNDKDYYFIVYFEKEEEFLFTSLKRLDTLTPNGNNLPFQCKWINNKLPTKRSIEEQSIYILNTFIESFAKKISGLDILLKWRNAA